MGAKLSGVRRFASWAEYDAAFQKFDGALSGMKTVHFKDIPWPEFTDSSTSILGVGDPSARKKRLRQALLRWHPDKWAGVLERIASSDRALVGTKLGEVTNAILEEKARI